jgi:DNA-binding LytR/AlgR family response regulator
MERYNCLIVDDEPVAREIIEKFCGHLPMLDIVGSCGQAFEAMRILKEIRVDILFLDINMPVLDGISFLKTLKVAPQVIFTTAYKEYATDAFDLAACDYLLKPFSLDRFIVAVGRAEEKLKSVKVADVKSAEIKETDYIFVRSEGKIYKISFAEFLYAEAKGNYTRIVTASSVLLPLLTFSALEKLLPASTFLRVHRSFIINMSKIGHVEGNRIFIQDVEIPIGSLYRDQFMEQLGLS